MLDATAKKHTFSLIIPVLHEAAIINTLLEHPYSLQSEEPFEIIVVDGSPEQDTIHAICHKDIVCLSADTGRAAQMNAGAAISRGEILIFLHADTRLPSNAFNLIKKVLSCGVYVGGAFNLGVRSDRFTFKLIAATASLRSRITRVPYGDQAFFFKRDYFMQIGGFSNIPLMEDLDLMRRIKKRRDKICILSDCVWASPRRWEKEGVVFGTLRNWLLVALYYLGVAPQKLARFYNSFDRKS